MTQQDDDIQRQLAQLEAQIAQAEQLRATLPSALQATMDATIAGLRQQREALLGNAAARATPSDPQTKDGRQGAFIDGGTANNVVGLNHGTIQNFFAGKPSEDGERLLADYLDALTKECQQLRLHRLTERRTGGNEQSRVPQIQLQDVYTSLTCDGPSVTVKERRRTVGHLRKLLERWEQLPHGPGDCPPEHIREVQLRSDRNLHIPVAEEGMRTHFDSAPDSAMFTLILTRPELALEAIYKNKRLVLLGDPGSGKSTVLRYLALALAQRGRDQSVFLHGWPQVYAPVPIICPLGRVAAAMIADNQNVVDALWQVLGDVLEGEPPVRVGLRDHLKPAIRQGGVIILCDGLDELPVESADGGSLPRRDVAAAIRQLVATAPEARVVVTSRVLPYQSPGDWHLRSDEGWGQRTLQPWAFGQVMRFVHAWYDALAEHDREINAQERAEDMIAKLRGNPSVQPLLRSPLLLTMLAILHYNTDDVPEDRAKVYDECVTLLLERWEPVRTPNQPRAGLLQKLGDIPNLNLDRLREVLHELAWEAHAEPPGNDGRGLLRGELLEGKLRRFFRRVGSLAADRSVDIFLQVLREDAGLLQALDDDRYAFPHLTFQEYLAACYLADQTDLVDKAYARWASPDGERWREALLLLMGRLRQQGQKAAERDGVPWLRRLTAERIGRETKTDHQRRRDAVLAALSYDELGTRVTLANTMLDLEAEVDAPLRSVLVRLLGERDDAIVFRDRHAAARVLGVLGDTRFPVTQDDWLTEFARCSERFGQPNGYWCYVLGGVYRISGWEEDQPSADITLQPFWVARFPITVAQFAPFVEEGYSEAAERWWTPEGWKWKQSNDRTQPWAWGTEQYSWPNQPVIGVTWYEATAFCSWLTEQYVNELPAGYELRLATEAEWEAAAAYDGEKQRREYSWGTATPTLAHAVYDESGLQQPAAIGCCAAGMAACGGYDLAGNVWGWTTSDYDGYPNDSGKKDFTRRNWVAVRGGAYYSDRTSVRCGSRLGDYPHYDFGIIGFRMIVAPRLAVDPDS